MFTARKGRLVALGAVVVGAAIALSGCASSNPISGGSGSGAKTTLVVGSQDYYSNEIVAEIYAQALENGGFTVDRQFKIVYRPVRWKAARRRSPRVWGNSAILWWCAPSLRLRRPAMRLAKCPLIAWSPSSTIWMPCGWLLAGHRGSLVLPACGVFTPTRFDRYWMLSRLSRTRLNKRRAL